MRGSSFTPLGDRRIAGSVETYRLRQPYQVEKPPKYGMVWCGKAVVNNPDSARIVNCAGAALFSRHRYFDARLASRRPRTGTRRDCATTTSTANHATAIESMVPFVQQVVDALTPEAPADEAGCGPCVTGARDPSLRQARCLGGRDKRIDARAMTTSGA